MSIIAYTFGVNLFVQVSGKIDWVKSARGAVETQCQAEIVHNGTLLVVKDGVLHMPEVIDETLCPEHCSGHGQCVDGMCSSFPGELSLTI